MDQSFLFQKETDWPEVFADWERREKGIWDAYFQGEGYEDWRAWRGKLMEPMHPEKRTWKIYKLLDPFTSIPQFWIGGFRGWRHYLPEGQKRIQFKDLIASPLIRENPKIMAVFQHFPQETTLMGFRLGNEVILAEGMHRCSAIAIKAAQGQQYETTVFMALTDFSEDERHLFDQCRSQQESGTFLDDLRTDKM